MVFLKLINLKFLNDQLFLELELPLQPPAKSLTKMLFILLGKISNLHIKNSSIQSSIIYLFALSLNVKQF